MANHWDAHSSRGEKNASEGLLEILRDQKRGLARGIYSICSANRFVIEACMQQADQNSSPLLIEATCNQVNQYGGYTGMNPQQFVQYVQEIAASRGFPTERIILGGDHLGPGPWQTEDVREAIADMLDIRPGTPYSEDELTKARARAIEGAGTDAPEPTDEEIFAEAAAERREELIERELIVPTYEPPVYSPGETEPPGPETEE